MPSSARCLGVCLMIPLLALMLANPTQAQFISGFVTDTGGTPIPFVDIDVFNSQGNEVCFANCGTNPDGSFLVTLPAVGVYTVSFRPPPPPVTTLLTAIVQDVVVIGTTDMGVVTLDPGLVFSGRVVDQGGVPLGNVDVELSNFGSGAVLPLSGNKTDLFGNFELVVPPGTYSVQLDGVAVLTTVVAPQVFPQAIFADTDIGDVAMEPGFHVQATFLGPGGFPILGVDLDAEDRVTGEKMLTLHDNSDESGALDTILPAGRYDLLFCPPEGSALIAAEVTPVNLGAPLNLGVFNLTTGVLLTGTVTGITGEVIPGTDVNLSVSVGGQPVALCNDNANAEGLYAVIVPTGTFDLLFTAPKTSLFGTKLVKNVTITGPTIVDVVIGSYLDTRDTAGPPGSPISPTGGQPPSGGTLGPPEDHGGGGFFLR